VIKKLEMGMETVNGKAFHTMSYELESESSFWGTRSKSDAVLYLHFPQDFERSHRFVGFLVQRNYTRGTFGKGSLDEIRPLLKSLQIK
jgi:hypothetical protein